MEFVAHCQKDSAGKWKKNMFKQRARGGNAKGDYQLRIKCANVCIAALLLLYRILMQHDYL